LENLVKPVLKFAAAAVMGLISCAALADSTAAPPLEAGLERAIFAGGCFWCVEHEFDDVAGVKSAVSGYLGGSVENPSYKQVSGGDTGHTEAVEIRYDPKQISYQKLLDIFWRNIDPTVANRQFCDIGPQYRSGIFYLDDAQKVAAEASRTALEPKFPGGIKTEITAASTFYLAEDYHQDYAKKNPVRYGYYRYSCGRDARLKELWGEPK
jgi:peptide-methionine (S)-S-oxide reductase